MTDLETFAVIFAAFLARDAALYAIARISGRLRARRYIAWLLRTMKAHDAVRTELAWRQSELAWRQRH